MIYTEFLLEFQSKRPVPVSKCSDKFPGELIFVGLIPRVSQPHPPGETLDRRITDRRISVTLFQPANFAE